MNTKLASLFSAIEQSQGMKITELLSSGAFNLELNGSIDPVVIRSAPLADNRTISIQIRSNGDFILGYIDPIDEVIFEEEIDPDYLLDAISDLNFDSSTFRSNPNFLKAIEVIFSALVLPDLPSGHLTIRAESRVSRINYEVGRNSIKLEFLPISQKFSLYDNTWLVYNPTLNYLDDFLSGIAVLVGTNFSSAALKANRRLIENGPTQLVMEELKRIYQENLARRILQESDKLSDIVDRLLILNPDPDLITMIEAIVRSHSQLLADRMR